jgi:hypothetical protein
MRRIHATLGAVAALFAAAAGCSARSSSPDSGDSAIRELERRAVGKAQPYPADVYSEDDAARFASSKKARRELGWRVLAKVLSPVSIAAASEVDSGGYATIPLFRTWLGGDELDRMFAKVYGDLGKDRRLKHDPPTDVETSAAFDWNATSLGQNSEADYFRRIAQLDGPAAVDGLAGNPRTAYSPGYVAQYLVDYWAIAGCDGKTNSFTFQTPGVSDTNFTDCFSHEFARDAAVVKASWRRNDALVTDGLAVQDTSADTLRQRLAGNLDNAGWPQQGMPMVQAGPDMAYTIQLQGGERYSLVGLHIITKELRHWVWTTIWWSPKADEDFGQDRPDAIRDLGGPWKNYKMCAVTDFDERDPDPRGGFDGSLGDALEAVHGPQTWCSNAFIEKGDHNARTNCIGCHQHAGDTTGLTKIIDDEANYPSTGRTKVRESFPADYSWAFATPDSPDPKDRLLRTVVNRIRSFQHQDGAGP